MSSKLAALALTAGISLPGLPAIPTYSAIDQIPVVGPAIVQTYKQLPPQVQRAIHLPLPLTAPAAAKRPVSYTHLRAHETN